MAAMTAPAITPPSVQTEMQEHRCVNKAVKDIFHLNWCIPKLQTSRWFHVYICLTAAYAGKEKWKVKKILNEDVLVALWGGTLAK